MSVPDVLLPNLPPNTIVPQENLDFDFVQYLNRLYEDIAFAVNARDFSFFTIPITDQSTSIPNMETFGAFLLCVSGEETGQPTGIWALCKSDESQAGVVLAPLNSQPGTIAPWASSTLTVTSTATNFQIKHSVANTTGNFNIRFIATQ